MAQAGTAHCETSQGKKNEVECNSKGLQRFVTLGLSMPQKDGMDGVLVQIKKGTVKSLLIFVSGMRKEQ